MPATTPSERFPDLVSVTAAVLIALLMEVLAGGPLYTEDLWWHLAAGENYLHQGLWPVEDPMLHTGLATGPVQHEWLFGSVLYVVHEAFGFQALRLVHATSVGAILWSLWTVLRRDGIGVTASAFALCVFVLLSWFRLFQLRPDLFSILATLALYALVLAARVRLNATRYVGLAVLFIVWANVHSLFLVGTNLMIAALLGVVLDQALARWLIVASAHTPRPRNPVTARALVIGIVVAMLAAMINPRGAAQHLTFITSSADTAVWQITDEWSHFRPWPHAANHSTVSVARWATLDLVLIGFAMAATLRFARLLRERSSEALAAFDPVRFGLGIAAIIAMLVSIRFMWMAFLPMAYILRGRAPGSAACRWATHGLMAASCVVLLVTFVTGYGFASIATRFAASPLEYLERPYRSHKFHAEGVYFLREADLRGRLFNSYAMGGFLGYWLAPRLRTFVDSRAEHYGADVFLDYSAITEMRGVRPGETFLDVLERRGVDVFFGIGFPGWWHNVYTTVHLAGIPGWRLVSRSYRHAIYVRVNERNRDNLARVAAYYRREGVPYDPARGLDPARVMRERPDWAIAHAMAPADWAGPPPDEATGDEQEAFALLLALNGAFETQVRADRARLTLEADAPGARLRLVHGLLRLDRPREALAEIEALLATPSPGPAAAQLAALTRRYAEVRGERPWATLSSEERVYLNRLLWHALPASPAETWPLEYRMLTEDLPLTRAPR